MKKNVILMLACTLLLSSCVYWGMYHFSDNDRVWLSPYDEGDTILFKSITNDMDTIIIKGKYIKDTYWPFMENEARDIMEAYGYIDMNLYHHAQLYEAGMGAAITKERTNKLRITLTFGYTRLDTRYSKLVIGTTEIGSIIYSDVCVVKGRKRQYCPEGEFRVRYFIWSKSKGLLQYKYLNGDVYTFYKKIPYKKD